MLVTYLQRVPRVSLVFLSLAVAGCSDSSSLPVGEVYEELNGIEIITVRPDNVLDFTSRGKNTAIVGNYQRLEDGSIRVSIPSTGQAVIYTVVPEGLQTKSAVGSQYYILYDTDHIVEARCSDLVQHAAAVAEYHANRTAQGGAFTLRSFATEAFAGDRLKLFPFEVESAGERYVVRVSREGCDKTAFWDSRNIEDLSLIDNDSVEGQWTKVAEDLEQEREAIAIREAKLAEERKLAAEKEQERLRQLYSQSQVPGRVRGEFTVVGGNRILGFKESKIQVPDSGLAGVKHVSGALRTTGEPKDFYSFCYLSDRLERAKFPGQYNGVDLETGRIGSRRGLFAYMFAEAFPSVDERERFFNVYIAAWRDWESQFSDVVNKGMCPDLRNRR